MDALKQATDLMKKTEEALRGLVTAAAKSGDYESVMQIAGWARTLSDLMRSPNGNTKALAQKLSEKNNRKIASLSDGRLRAARLKNTDYPRFFRRGNERIRLAWSKREKKEYRHKSPYSALQALTVAIAEKGTDGRVFSTDEFLPIHDVADGTEIPNYQAYLGISLLKQAALIDQHGRQGYSVPRMSEFKNAVEALWKKLPEQ